MIDTCISPESTSDHKLCDWLLILVLNVFAFSPFYFLPRHIRVVILQTKYLKYFLFRFRKLLVLKPFPGTNFCAEYHNTQNLLKGLAKYVSNNGCLQKQCRKNGCLEK